MVWSLIFVLTQFAFATNEKPWQVPDVTEHGQPCANGGRYKVSLSFDDGPHRIRTEKVLDVLKDKNVQATFFVSTIHFPSLAAGKRPRSSEQHLIKILERIRSEKHTLGSHSYQHMDHAEPLSSDPDPEVNLRNNDTVLKKLGLFEKGMPFRFPYGSGWVEGHGNQSVIKKVKDRGFVPIHWDVESWDWSKIKRKALPDSILRQICSHGGGIVLMHDIQEFETQGRPTNLAKLIDWIRKSGHKIVPLEEIKSYQSPILGKFPSMADEATDYKSCKRVGSKDDLDSVWSSCKDYETHSSDRNKKGVSQ
jgi:peptidoglycan/xylan/chitin deacetylase (PgdA/CDA1 family)